VYFVRAKFGVYVPAAYRDKKVVGDIAFFVQLLLKGNYRYSVSDGRCRSASSADVVINVYSPILGGWSWSLGSSPTSLNHKIVFAADYPPTVDPNVDIIGCSCLVFGNVVIKDGRTLKIEKR
jgi:hypothetical protein